MKQTTPFFIAVTCLSAVMVALVMFWLAFLPNRLSSGFIAELEERTGLHAKVAGNSLGFGNGLSLQLSNVSLSQGEGQSVPLASIDHVSASLPFSTLFGAKPVVENLELENPVINIKTERTQTSLAQSGDGVATGEIKKKVKPVSLTIRNGTVKWSDTGRQGSISASDLQGTLKVEADGVAALELAGLFNGKLTRLSASLDDVKRLRGDGSPSDMTLSSQKNMVSFSGRTQLHDGVQLDGRIAASSENLKGMLDWFGLQLKGFENTGELKTESALSWNGSRLELKDVALQLGTANIKGSSSLDLSAARPSLEAKLSANSIDLGLYSHAKEKTQASDQPSLQVPWNESTRDFGDLSAVDAKIDATADKVIIGKLSTGAASLALDLQNGNLVMTLNSADVAGGKAAAELRIVKNEALPKLQFKLQAENVSAKQFLEPLTGFAALDGPVSINADLNSQGDSQARLISSLAGQAQLRMTNGSLNGLTIATFLAGKGKGWRLAANQTTTVADLDALFDIQDGIAQVSNFQIGAAGMKISASGEVDLLRQNLEIICKPQVDGVVKLPLQVSISGSWNDPSVDTDIDPLKLKPKALLKSGKKAIKKLFGN